VLARVEKLGDIFAPVLNLKQRLPDVSELGTESESKEASRTASKSKTVPAKKQSRKTPRSSVAFRQTRQAG
jgi:hypothetical protein